MMHPRPVSVSAATIRIWSPVAVDEDRRSERPRATSSAVVECRRGDLNPYAPQRALGPQPSASTEFRHSDVVGDSTKGVPRGGSGPLPAEPERADAEDDGGADRDLVHPALQRGAPRE